MILDFLWHLRGSVSLDRKLGGEAAIDAVQRLLVQQRKPVTRQSLEHLTFYDPLWRLYISPNWLAMLIYDRGKFWVSQGGNGGRLYYDLRSLHAMMFCLFLAAMFFAMSALHGDLESGVIIAIQAFAWLYGINLLIAVARVPLAIRKAVRQSCYH